MNRIGQYLLSVIAVSVLIAISDSLITKKGQVDLAFKLLTGIILTLVIVTPWTEFRWNEYEAYLYDPKEEASSIIRSAEEHAKAEISTLIKQKTKAYILDKADSFSASVAVDVELSKETPTEISKIRITGNVSPYVKKRLKKIISNDLGVSEANQEWL